MMPVVTRTRRGCRYWRNLLLVAATAVSSVALGAICVALPLMHADDVAHPPHAALCCATPADAGLEFEEVSFTTADGVLLRGWYVPPRNRAAVAIAHGAGGTRAAHLDQAAALARRGYGVLLFDLRAHGESGGTTATLGGADVAAAVGYLASREDVEPSRIGAWGFSLGGSAAIQAAAETDQMRAVVTDGAAAAVFADMPPPESLVDLLWVPFDRVWFQSLARWGVAAPVGLMDVLPRLTAVPILFVSGAGKDYEKRAQRRYYAACTGLAVLWQIPEAKHVGGCAARPEEYEARVVDFSDHALLGWE